MRVIYVLILVRVSCLSLEGVVRGLRTTIAPLKWRNVVITYMGFYPSIEASIINAQTFMFCMYALIWPCAICSRIGA